MTTIKEKVDFALKGGTVERFHTRPLIHRQNNAEHQYGVVTIAALLDTELSKQSLLRMLWHDVHEGQTGDIPYYSKLNWPDLKVAVTKAESELDAKYNLLPQFASEQDKITLKIAEYFDVMIFCSKETYLGNTEFLGTIQECVDLIETLVMQYDTFYGTVFLNTYELLQELMYEFYSKTGTRLHRKMDMQTMDSLSNNEFGG